MYFSKDYLNKALINGPKEESIDEISKYIYSNRLIIFFILFMSYLFVSYSVCPQKIESAFSRNATMIYIICVTYGLCDAVTGLLFNKHIIEKNTLQ